MHAVLAITSLHLRYLETANHAATEVYHTQRTSALLNSKLSKPIAVEDADAIFATATLLNGIAFASVETTQPHKSWPLSSKPNNLQWLSLQQGIGLMTLATNPWRKGSAFESLFNENDDDQETFTDKRPGKAGLPQDFVDLCVITADSTADNNPYHAALRMLAPLFRIRRSMESLTQHLNFISSMRPEFISLLQQKDHRALLILSYWYGLMCEFQVWWMTQRVTVECTAICMYLDSCADSRIRQLLHFPAHACGYSLQASRESSEIPQEPSTFVPCTPM